MLKKLKMIKFLKLKINFTKYGQRNAWSLDENFEHLIRDKGCQIHKA